MDNPIKSHSKMENLIKNKIKKQITKDSIGQIRFVINIIYYCLGPFQRKNILKFIQINREQIYFLNWKRKRKNDEGKLK